MPIYPIIHGMFRYNYRALTCFNLAAFLRDNKQF